MLSERIKKWPDEWMEKGMQKGYEKAQAEADKRVQEEKQAAEKRLQDTAKNLLAMNMMTDDQIAQATGLEVQMIQELRQSMTQH